MPHLLLSSGLFFNSSVHRGEMCAAIIPHYKIVFLLMCIEYLLHQNNFLFFLHSTKLFGSLDNNSI